MPPDGCRSSAELTRERSNQAAPQAADGSWAAAATEPAAGAELARAAKAGARAPSRADSADSTESGARGAALAAASRPYLPAVPSAPVGAVRASSVSRDAATVAASSTRGSERVNPLPCCCSLADARTVSSRHSASSPPNTRALVPSVRSRPRALRGIGKCGWSVCCRSLAKTLKREPLDAEPRDAGRARRSDRDSVDAPQQQSAITAYQVSLRPSTIKAADPREYAFTRTHGVPIGGSWRHLSAFWQGCHFSQMPRPARRVKPVSWTVNGPRTERKVRPRIGTFMLRSLSSLLFSSPHRCSHAAAWRV